MPRGDGTGPMGMGPMTGKGAGYCAGYQNTGFGFGCGRGFNASVPMRARMNCFGYGMSGNQMYNEKEILNNQAEVLENRLQEIKKRLLNIDENK